jgi:hypothetical protein
MKRSVTYKEEEITFRIDCADCPLSDALKTLGKEPRPCISGIMTNMQGHVPIATCEHYKKDSIENTDGNGLAIECGKEAS